MTTETRSDYLGVYHNRSENSKAEVPFRAAIRRGHGEKATWVNLGYFKSEIAAARIYNMYALCFFGTGAILNEFDALDPVSRKEFNDFVNAKPKRLERLAQATKIATEAGDGAFRTNKDLAKERLAA